MIFLHSVGEKYYFGIITVCENGLNMKPHSFHDSSCLLFTFWCLAKFSLKCRMSSGFFGSHNRTSILMMGMNILTFTQWEKTS